MFTVDAPSYRIDLNLPEAQRWSEAIAHEVPVAGVLVQEACKEFERVPELARWLLSRLYQSSGGLYRGEIAAWADALGVSVGTATMLNCAYELSHLRWPKLFGCTAGVRWLDGLGMVHLRTLDWPLATMGQATRFFRFQRGAREFVSVGVPGQVGVLSGMLPGGYSVTINWAPPIGRPSFDFGPTFLLRDTLETCDRYDDAVEKLRQTRLSTSVFFTVCGTQQKQACVIERTQHEAAVRPMADEPLVQANHHIAQRFARNNKDIYEVDEGEEEFSLAGSRSRVVILRDALANLGKPDTLEEVLNLLDRPTVMNKFTCQKMAFCPARGELRVSRRTEECVG